MRTTATPEPLDDTHRFEVPVSDVGRRLVDLDRALALADDDEDEVRASRLQEGR